MLKPLSFFIFFLLWLGILKAHAPDAPHAINYQAVVRDNAGAVVSNRLISLRLSIIDSSAGGSSLYSEIFRPTTNQLGLFSLDIGTGSPVSGSFSTINWGVNSKWLKVETDITGGSSYVLMGTSQLVSVPYALYSEKSGSANNLNSVVSGIGDTLYIGNTFIIIPGVSGANACRMDFADTIPYTRNYPQAAAAIYNASAYGLPKFILKNYIELDKIDSISRFRSGVGHDYSDYYESCRSMKHYFRPRANLDWSTIKIFSPVNGIISDTMPDSYGTQVWITPLGMPAFVICIFHVHPAIHLVIGDTLLSGQLIGTHIGNQTESDIAVQVTEPNGTWQRVSYFDVITDKLLACYIAHGVTSRDSMIISKAARDADTLNCLGAQFLNSGTINNWVTLH